MELIVATPQGDAELSVDAVHESVTVADLLQQVLPSAPPAVVHIDGVPVASGTLLSAAGLLQGSVVSVLPNDDDPADRTITLVQAAGEGGGHRRPLGPGRYSLGTARRANVVPLSNNQVLVPRCEIVVGHDGTISVAANQGDLDGRSATIASEWTTQRLRIGHRVFRLDPPIRDRAAGLQPTGHGHLVFDTAQRVATAAVDNAAANAEGGGRRLRRGRHERADTVRPAPIDAARTAFDAELERVRRTHPDLGEVIRRATSLSERLWERRPHDDDAFVFSVGLADQAWSPDDPRHERHDLALLPCAPVLVDLLNERGIGYASSPSQARAAARALVLQACVTHSPADLEVVVLSTPTGGARWEWIKWLPHARGAQGVQLLCDEASILEWVNAQRTLTTVVASIQSLRQPIMPSRLTLVVVDDPTLWRGRAAILRGVFAEAQLPVRFIALTDRADDVPAVCTTVVRIGANGAAEVDYPLSGPSVTDVVPFVLDHDVAMAAARRLSPLEDQATAVANKPALPTVVPLSSMIDPDGIDASRIARRWASTRDGRVSAAIGRSERGVVELDVGDGDSNCVVLGTRRSGKTEALRTIVASLAAQHDPDTVNFVCIEATEGTSFDVVRDLDHVVGSIVQFDEHGGTRLLRALRSEMIRRSRSGRSAHLVIVIDDADDIAVRHPGFLTQLMDLLEPGRQLGVSVVMSMERVPRSLDAPTTGSVSTRIALRLADSADATTFVGSREPVQISNHTPGRALIKVSDGDPTAIQIASVTRSAGDLLQLTPFILARDPNAAERKLTQSFTEPAREPAPRDVREIVEAVQQAARLSERSFSARPLLPPPLPVELAYEDLSSRRAGASAASFGIADLPEDHSQNLSDWYPQQDGNVLITGGLGLERWNAMVTMLVAACDTWPTDRLHCYIVDCSPAHSGSSKVLEPLAACAAVATADDPDRIVRVLDRLDEELAHRAGADDPVTEPHLLLFVHDVPAMLRTLELHGDAEHGRDVLERLAGKGRTHGITVVLCASSENALSARLVAQIQRRIVFHLGDRASYRALEVEPGRVPLETPGRALILPEVTEVQFATVTDLAGTVATRIDRNGATHGPASVPRTPARVSVEEIAKGTHYANGSWSIPIGLDARSLDVAALTVRAPGGALVLGDSGSGKSTALANLARCALAIDTGVDVHAVAATWSPLLLLPHLASATTLAGIDKWAAELFTNTDRDRLVLVDDADRLDGPVFERLAALGDPRLVVIAAGRTRVLEIPSHWTAPLRRSRAAIILRPLPGDATMFGLNLTTSATHPAVGRGLLVDDEAVVPVLMTAPVEEPPT